MKKIFVGMSGGVDSSVSAHILKSGGYDVTGVFIKVWQPDFIECTWKQDRLDALRVAGELDIPFITLDLEKEYKRSVIDYMVEEYKLGRTPNPDVFCNKEIKFGAFLTWAKEHGADYIATGHYANTDGKNLIVSRDKDKDQTYFLWTLKKEILPEILFPVGNFIKGEVRDYARKNKISVSEKKDSQGLCFVGEVNLKTLLKGFISEKTGDVILKSGEIIGFHEGIQFFTIGERHGFVVTKKRVDDLPYFVIDKDIEKNLLVVSHDAPKEEKGKIISLVKTNWLKNIKKGEIYEARARYRAPLSKVEIMSIDAVKVLEGEITKTAGQSLVLYHKDICIGGGVIK